MSNTVVGTYFAPLNQAFNADANAEWAFEMPQVLKKRLLPPKKISQRIFVF